jgi:DNA-binding NtrC family response regulator
VPTSRRKPVRRTRPRPQPAAGRAAAVLLIERNREAARDLAARLRESFALETAADVEAALELLDRRGADAVILRLGAGDPADLRRVHAAHPQVPVYVVGDPARADAAFTAGRLGASAFLPDTGSPAELARAVLEVWNRAHPRGKAAPDPERIAWQFVGRSDAIMRLLEDAETVASVDSTVLLTGESGTGKEVLARWIHHHGPRAEGPFITVNCPAIPAGLFESELFGHEAGSFTDARALRRGRFELATGGVLFLDEITEIPLGSQSKLLGALDSKEYFRVGGERSNTVDARVICASNRDLNAEVSNGRFREDLFYRINVVWLHLPPLRERREDVPLLAEHFLRLSSAELGKSVDGFAPEALSFLAAYDWPGNVRELAKLIERALVFCRTKRIGPELLAPVAARTPLLSLPWDDARELALRQFERNYVSALLRIYGGAVARVARAMGITRQALYKTMERADLDPAAFRPIRRRAAASEAPPRRSRG